MNYDEILVSVVIPTHNRPMLLRETLISVVNQSHANLEIFVISDGINYQNESIVKELRDDRILYFDQENSGGPSLSRNIGIALSKGEYIAFCDDDDIWLPNKIKEQIKSLEDNKSFDFCYCKMIRFDVNREWVCLNEEGYVTFDSII